jgi:DNA-directed RNA polymerase subunit N (RpoN/RPB10)
MIVPIRCFTCGKIVADKYEYYVREKDKLEASNEDNEDYKYFSKIHTKKILDNLGLTRYCCRRMMLGTVDMMDFI